MQCNILSRCSHQGGINLSLASRHSISKYVGLACRIWKICNKNCVVNFFIKTGVILFLCVNCFYECFALAILNLTNLQYGLKWFRITMFYWHNSSTLPFYKFVVDFINLGLARLLRPQDAVRALYFGLVHTQCRSICFWGHHGSALLRKHPRVGSQVQCIKW